MEIPCGDSASKNCGDGGGITRRLNAFELGLDIQTRGQTRHKRKGYDPPSIIEFQRKAAHSPLSALEHRIHFLNIPAANQSSKQEG